MILHQIGAGFSQSDRNKKIGSIPGPSRVSTTASRLREPGLPTRTRPAPHPVTAVPSVDASGDQSLLKENENGGVERRCPAAEEIAASRVAPGCPRRSAALKCPSWRGEGDESSRGNATSDGWLLLKNRGYNRQNTRGNKLHGRLTNMGKAFPENGARLRHRFVFGSQMPRMGGIRPVGAPASIRADCCPPVNQRLPPACCPSIEQALVWNVNSMGFGLLGAQRRFPEFALAGRSPRRAANCSR